jgi:hypothetical protein
MKPLSLIVIAILSVVFISYSPYKMRETDLEKMHLSGSVKWIKQWLVEPVGNTATATYSDMMKSRLMGRDSSNFLFFFDEGGWLIEAEYYDKDSMQQERDDYRYDVHGRLDEQVAYSPWDNDRTIKVSYKYNNNDELREEAFYYNETQVPSTEWWFEYDVMGRVKTKYEGNSAHYNGITIYNYDSSGNLLGYIINAANNFLRRKGVYTYCNGKIKEFLLYNLSDTTFWIEKEIYTFDKVGNKVEEIRYGQTPIKSDTGVLILKQGWKYYDNNIVVHTYFPYCPLAFPDIGFDDGKPKITRDSTIIQYDSLGNWTKQTSYYNDSSYCIKYRAIGYY